MSHYRAVIALCAEGIGVSYPKARLGGFMRGNVAPIVAALAALYAVVVLLSAHGTPTGLALVNHQERVSDLESRLIQMLMLQLHQLQSKTDRTRKAQQALKDTGFYAGPVDGVMRQQTEEAILAFQQSRNLRGTGTIDDETAHQLRLY